MLAGAGLNDCLRWVPYSACLHVTLLDWQVASGSLQRPHRNDPAIQLLAERCIQHENRKPLRDVLEQRHGEPAFRVPGAIRKTTEQWEVATGRTLEAMRGGTASSIRLPWPEPAGLA
jgi:hypothetical protein